VTGKEQALEILKDGQPHSHRELYHRLRANPNVISKLRAEGWEIETERRGGTWWYQLHLNRRRPQPAPLLTGEEPALLDDQLSMEDVL
jgi:hypothetical protein